MALRPGPIELILIVLFCLFNVGLPVLILLVAMAIYSKVRKIEQTLNQKTHVE
jgi:hypothetical protein